MTRTIALTGATGFIGQHLIQHFREKGWRVRALTRQVPPAPATENVTWVRGALDGKASLEDLCRGAETVVHCAGAIKAVRPSGFYEANVDGTRNVIQAAVASGCRRMIHVSSLAARTPPLSDYAASKRAGEDVVSQQDDLGHWTILRPPAVYGPGDRETLKILRLMKMGVAPVPGSVANRSSFIHSADLCRAVIACAETEKTASEVIELRDTTEGGYDWQAICDAASTALGRSILRITIPRAALWPVAAANEGLARVTDNAFMMTRGKLRELFHDDWSVNENRLCDLTDWRPEIDLEQGFKETFDWYRSAGWL